MTEPVWLSFDDVVLAHQKLIGQFGGKTNAVRDMNLLHSALASPQNLYAYSNPPPSLFDLAAKYAFALAKNHAFIDGNKRIAFTSAVAFLDQNGIWPNLHMGEVVTMTEGLAAGEVTESAYADWLRRNAK